MGTFTLCFDILLVSGAHDSIWYPSLTLYRQPTLDDWDSVYETIRNDLKQVDQNMSSLLKMIF